MDFNPTFVAVQSTEARTEPPIHDEAESPTPIRTPTEPTFTDLDDLTELQNPTDWVVPAAITALFCFPPTGVAAFVYARKANKAYADGDLRTWKHSYGRARFLVLLTCMCGILFYAVIVGVVHGIKHYTS
ncbi:transmembrane protein 91-like [Mya arenaria]|uniref:transmembrane protein 91-like n=1 Tax=Mya arenaria TaxID=6604 RepID=UPI0022E42FA9|nr:transmembrane protein 91-like [Mya arenaria]